MTLRRSPIGRQKESPLCGGKVAVRCHPHGFIWEEVEQPKLPFGSVNENGAVGSPASDTTEKPEERSNDTKA